jgi:MoaA/NifB/PqqE/SkfB family radical SAM enzyme
MTLMDDRPVTATSFLWLDLTRRCNLACTQCYNGSGVDGEHGSMQREDWLNVIDQAAAADVRMVQLIGTVSAPRYQPRHLALLGRRDRAQPGDRP